MPDAVPFRLLEHAQRLFGSTNAAHVLVQSCREALALTGADVAYATCTSLRQPWERGLHVAVNGASVNGDSVEVSKAARSALFALHRKLAVRPAPTSLARDEHEAIFRGLAPSARALCALPLVQPKGRLVGEVTLLSTRDLEVSDALIALATTTRLALEAAHRFSAAKRDQDRMLLLAEATDEALWDWNLDSNQCWWGGSIYTLLGAEIERGLDPSWRFEHIHREDVAHVRSSLERALRSGEPSWREEYRFRRVDGSWLHVEDRAFFLREADGRAYRAIGALRDITPLRQLLEREREARAEAERASRAKDEFLAMLGHELRNPLAPIVTAVHLMRQRGGLAIDRELTVVERQSQHLVRLVDDLLDVARITRGKVELKKEVIDVAAVVAKALEMARPLLDQNRHCLDLDVPFDDLRVFGDPARLAQVIANLVTNAAKYTDPGGNIRIRARCVDGEVELRVSDNGIGIAPDILPHVFDMFVQERQGIERSQGGLGLGLSIVQNLVKLHGGSVSAESGGRGRGSEFTIRLPAAPTERAGQPRPGHRLSTGSTSQGRRVLIVDDNQDAAGLLAELLEAMGNTTCVAHDGPSALRVFDDFAPELAVLDIGLPVMDGYELARELRCRYPDPQLKLIALTGYGRDSDRQRTREARFDAHLVKPVAVAQLQAMLRDM
ncbi:MAG TPA: ATP-binding protein [Kofleriaceae bacterium]|nr:ATP-binding protein [Kofleriaceae bacterium]